MKECKHIYFVKSESADDSWQVFAKKDDFLLGTVDWFPRWKGFVFEPTAETIYESTCLTDIARFIKEQNAIKKSPGGKPK